MSYIIAKNCKFAAIDIKKTLTITAAVLIIAASACKKDGVYSVDQYANTPIADYLYGVEYDDYSLDANVDHSNGDYLSSAAACTEVRKGNFVGRNLDWYINTDASAIIKMNHTKDHYASIGMVGCCPNFSNDLAKAGAYNEIYKYLPFKTTDGINEKGLYIGVNVAPTGETSFDQSTWEPYAYGHGAANTNPASDMHYVVNYLVRIVLDRAGSELWYTTHTSIYDLKNNSPRARPRRTRRPGGVLRGLAQRQSFRQAFEIELQIGLFLVVGLISLVLGDVVVGESVVLRLRIGSSSCGINLDIAVKPLLDILDAIDLDGNFH